MSVFGEMFGDAGALGDGDTRQGTAREFGLLDSAYACVVGAHFAASQPLEDYARQLSGQILNQTTPALTADTFKQQLEALAGEIAKITKRNPLDEVYSGPVFPQSQNDLFSGRLLDTPAHALEEAAPAVAKKIADVGAGVSDFFKTAGTVLVLGVVGIGGFMLYSASMRNR